MKKYLIYCVITIAVLGCNSEKKFNNESADTVSSNLLAEDTTLSAKIIKTADMRFRVKDVQQTKEQLSSAVKTMGGTIAEFSIQSTIAETDKVKYSTDSLLELTSYHTEGLILAKVPSDQLDEFTNRVAKMALFVDNQSMKLDDQSISYLENNLKNQNRVEAVAQLNKHATKKSNNVETSLYIKDDYVDKKIENMRINDKVKYSNITLNFYQANTIKSTLVLNDNLYDYRPGFFKRLWLGIDNGWTIFKEFILAISNLWMLIVIGIAGYLMYRYFRKKKLEAV
ncbi:DUF4349 domain-containing protein [Pedobacter metabolipauper]|uniref:Uncharacterized protein DUF4349 n=1 Tax=Pedobacter metabolipauper TaxID=425513 RepID=A0A4R6SR18_9SPHI|nr:DUF4349 domain-containing protein [Pedobacter metabolipauper]TDQ06665.1 uncharacterized protein DUF4349 [Pedobacter metabolipauper]